MNKTDCQHFLHPLNLWCRFRGKGKWFWQRIYEPYLWQPFLRERLMKNESPKNKRNNKHNSR